jgi:small subunit ribosomal protein S4e
VPEGNFQLNLHDGRNILLNVDAGINSEEFKTFDTVKINLPDQKILEHLSFAEGSLILVTSGGNIGKTGIIKRIAKGSAARPPMVTIEDSEKNTFQTIVDYIFVIGKKESLIQLGM